MEPSSFMISQMTPAGMRPAMRARSTEASVWPARTRTPPLRARSGKTWPGRARSWALELGLIATWMVWARSAAEMPVVTPSRASMGLGEGSAEARGVVLGHGTKAHVVGALLGEGEADEGRGRSGP